MSDDTVRKRKEPPEELSLSSQRRRNLTLEHDDDNDSICQRCSTIKWSQISPPREQSATGELVASCELSRTQMRASGCQLCKSLSLLYPSTEDKSAYEIRAYSAETVFGNRRSGNNLANIHRDTTLIGVTQPRKRGYKSCLGNGGFLAIIHNEEDTVDFGARPLHRDKIHFDKVLEWMSTCEAMHARKCFPVKPVTVPGLHFFDCEDMRVVPATSDRYIALSYVWGDSSDDEMPLVVRDSITVTKKLGYRYLWVDRYVRNMPFSCLTMMMETNRRVQCIKQDSTHKHEQIAQMHNIYAQSHLTIIAAAGQDAHFGLPGITRPRRNQARVKLDGVDLVHVPTNTLSEIRATRWATRGWTYQEAFMAKRRLIFTNTQVSYLCGGFYCLESIIQPLDTLNIRGGDFFSALVPLFKPRALKRNLGQLSTTRLAIRQHLMEYSKRELSHDSDALNACLGILQHVNSGKHAVTHLWGIPVEINREESKPYLSIDLAWTHDKPAERRDEFPSWTWVGWKGPVNLNHAGLDVMRMSSFDFAIEVLDDSSEPTELINDMAQNRPILTQETLKRQETIRITSRAVELSVSYKVWWNTPDSHEVTVHFPSGSSQTFINNDCPDGLYCRLSISEDIYIQAYILVDDPDLKELYEFGWDKLQGLLVYEQREIKSLHLREQTVLVVRNSEEPISEDIGMGARVGLLRIRYPWGIWSKQWASENGPFSSVVFTDKLGNRLNEVHMPEETELWIEEAEIRSTVLR